MQCEVWSVECEDFASSLAEKIKRLSREGHGRDRVSLNYRSFMFGKLPPPACPGLCYIDGMRQEIDEDVFDQMAQALHQSNNPHNPPPITSTRWQPDGTYDKKPLDPKYFQKYYQKKLTTPFTCPDCGRTISRKSNLSKHRQTNRYMDSRPH